MGDSILLLAIRTSQLEMLQLQEAWASLFRPFFLCVDTYMQLGLLRACIGHPSDCSARSRLRQGGKLTA